MKTMSEIRSPLAVLPTTDYTYSELEEAVKRHFEFNQPLKELTCGWRCLAYIVRTDYYAFIEKYSCMKPKKHGMYLPDIIRILQDYKVEWYHSFPTEKGLYLILLYRREGGPHYVVYDDGFLYDSLTSKSQKKSIESLQLTLEMGKYNDENWPFIIRINK